MMIAEIVGGALFGSLALVADGLHMSTHAGALLLAALAYTYARKYADDRRFTFGTGKFGDLAGYTSAIMLAMIALLIGYEAVVAPARPGRRSASTRRSRSRPSAFSVNVVSAWLLGGRPPSRPWPRSRAQHITIMRTTTLTITTMITTA